MKKAISLCAMTMLGIAAICQDTTSQRKTTDTIPGSNNMQADTSKWNSNSRKDSMGQGNLNRANQTGTWPNSNDTTPGNRNNSLDTSRQREPMEGSRDSMNRGMTPNTSSDTLNRNQNSNNAGLNRNDSTNATSGSNTSATGNNSGSSSADSTATAEKVSDRVTMADDKIYVIKNGDSTILSKEFKLSSGASILPDGTVKYPTGKSVNLKNGQFIELPKKSESAETDNGTKATKKSPAKKKTTKKSTTQKKTTGGSQNQ